MPSLLDWHAVLSRRNVGRHLKHGSLNLVRLTSSYCAGSLLLRQRGANLYRKEEAGTRLLSAYAYSDSTCRKRLTDINMALGFHSDDCSAGNALQLHLEAVRYLESLISAQKDPLGLPVFKNRKMSSHAVSLYALGLRVALDRDHMLRPPLVKFAGI